MTTTDNVPVLCECVHCTMDGMHSSDCGVHNPPDEPWKPCSCGLAIGNIWRDANEALNGRRKSK